MCPICYCKECFFDSATFESEADEYFKWAEKKGALKMPNDTLLFHLTRLNHMAVSCVGCGMCQEACPHGIPVFNIFSLVGAQLQKQFDYVPGKDITEEPPMTVFRENELGEIG
jgi:formate dehydrogenase subunit beta